MLTGELRLNLELLTDSPEQTGVPTTCGGQSVQLVTDGGIGEVLTQYQGKIES
jgi:hypothetical protein